MWPAVLGSKGLVLGRCIVGTLMLTCGGGALGMLNDGMAGLKAAPTTPELMPCIGALGVACAAPATPGLVG